MWAAIEALAPYVYDRPSVAEDNALDEARAGGGAEQAGAAGADGVASKMWFHELSPYRCAVLRMQFPGETIVEGDIAHLHPAEVPEGQCHFFAGVGGFGLACEWAGFDLPLWTGGFPCQDVSCAGKGAGLDGKRSGLWFEWLRIIRARRPVRLLIENVPALRTRGYDGIHDALEAEGYAVRSIVVGAEAVGAPHRRNRVWIVAKRDGGGVGDANQPRRLGGPCGSGTADACRGRSAIPDAESDERGSGRGEPEDESGWQCGRRESAGGVQLADAESGGQRAEGGAPNARHTDQCVEAVADTYEAGRRERRGAVTVRAQCDSAERGGGVALTGCGRQPQHAVPPGPWPEGQRTPRADGSGAMVQPERQSCGTGNVEPIRGQERGVVARWPMPPGSKQHEWEAPRLVEPGVGRSAHGLPRRLAGFARRNALQALGDSIVPQVAAAILRAWKEGELIRE